jgi:YfiH family protein
MHTDFIQPNWPAANKIRAYTTTRIGGVSVAPYDSFNLAAHVGDNLDQVEKNRAILREKLQLPAEPLWLTQTHGTHVVAADATQPYIEADASYTDRPNVVCAVQTADCLPLLICNRDATLVAAIHAGWKGLAAGVIESTLTTLNVPGNELLVWLGPAMGPQAFEIGKDVYQAFTDKHSEAELGFKAISAEKWLANIYLLAKQRLHAFGITAIYGGEFCTFTESEKFFSYRRNPITGRMASLIWISPE